MKRVFSLFVLLALCVHCFSQTSDSGKDKTFLKSPDGIYHIYLPESWRKEAPAAASIHFALAPPDAKKSEIPAAISLEVLPVSADFKEANIREITDKELEITKAQYGDRFSVLSQTYRTLNNKEWSQMVAEVRVSKKKAYKFYLLKSVHNGQTYTLSLKGESDEYDKYLQPAFAAFQTFMFYTADNTVYRNDAHRLDPSAIAARLKNFAGVFIFKPNENFFQLVAIDASNNGSYEAREMRQITRDGKNYQFEAKLKVEEITNEKVVLATDAVLKTDPGMRFGKAVYDLTPTTDGLSGQFKAKDSSFEQYDLVLRGQKPAGGKTQLEKPKEDVVKKAEAKKAPVVEKQPGKEEAKEGTRTYPDPSDGWTDEKNIIAKFGNGKVRRASDHELVFTLTNGKEITIKEKYDSRLKIYTSGYGFGGYSDAFNSFVLQQDDGFGTFVNRTTGILSDEISSIYDVLDSAEQRMSPDKKWLFGFRWYETEDDDGEVVVYSIPAGIKKVFKLVLGKDNTTKDWRPDNSRWLNETTYEIDKGKWVGEDFKATGQVWLVVTNGKWSVSNKKPSNSFAKILPSVTDLPKGYPKNAADGPKQIPSMSGSDTAGKGTKTSLDVLPYVKGRTFLNTTTPDELGRALLNALKAGDKTKWYQGTYNQARSGTDKIFDRIKEYLQSRGLTDWKAVTYRRTTYLSGPRSRGEEGQISYPSFKIEFNYGTDFVGAMDLGRAFMWNGKCLFDEISYFGSNMIPKEQYH